MRFLLSMMLWLAPLSVCPAETVDSGALTLSNSETCECEALRIELAKKDKEIRRWKLEAAYQRYRGDRGQQLYDGLKPVMESLRGKVSPGEEKK